MEDQKIRARSLDLFFQTLDLDLDPSLTNSEPNVKHWATPKGIPMVTVDGKTYTLEHYNYMQISKSKNK